MLKQRYERTAGARLPSCALPPWRRQRRVWTRVRCGVPCNGQALARLACGVAYRRAGQAAETWCAALYRTFFEIDAQLRADVRAPAACLCRFWRNYCSGVSCLSGVSRCATRVVPRACGASSSQPR